MSKRMSVWDGDAFQQRLRKRYRNERLFRSLGFASIVAGLLFLVVLLTSIVGNGWSAF